MGRHMRGKSKHVHFPGSHYIRRGAEGVSVLPGQQTIQRSRDKESNMRKNPQKRCHRHGDVSTTRLSDDSTNKEQMHRYAHEPGRAAWKWFLSSEHCPQFPLGPRHLSNSNRGEQQWWKNTSIFLMLSLSALSCQHKPRLLPTPHPTLLH